MENNGINMAKKQQQQKESNNWLNLFSIMQLMLGISLGLITCQCSLSCCSQMFSHTGPWGDHSREAGWRVSLLWLFLWAIPRP